ncbi:hypothetical protein FB451DRAFT_1255334 [Mycena latifolia]|nr:hypothetical protein FB451DRAFT_1255334 [Mycena latifolia]
MQVLTCALASATVVPAQNMLLALGSARSAPPTAVLENDFSLATGKDVAVNSRIVRPVASGSRDMDPGTVLKGLSPGHVA